MMNIGVAFGMRADGYAWSMARPFLVVGTI
jgi:hypothetical protein